MGTTSLLSADVTEAILKSFYYVYNSLGYGFLEKVYENALRISLTKSGFHVRQQWPITVQFEDEPVGKYFADLLVNDDVIVEIKVAESIGDDHQAQLINYLKATGHQVGLILCFGPTAEFRRKVFTQ